MKEGDYLEALGVDGMIILKFTLNNIRWHEEISVGQQIENLRCVLKKRSMELVA